MSSNMPIPLNTIRAGYVELSCLVNTALWTQQGDAARLGAVRRDCINLLDIACQHRIIIPATELTTLEEILLRMVDCLDEATQQSSDPAQHPFGPTTSLVHTGVPGRPHIDIDVDLLSVALDLRGPTHLASIFQCHPHTIQLRALEYGLAQPGAPVYVEYETEDGQVLRIY
ncbi:hypothetical protein H0H81_003005 [Sphagnurus paluster]|uniref:Uncharacterized protein n=1 Tax=Sphagnurus paluster TaxID=117069 RepID=A0A9P7GHW4_9AGAR|nr:hypothetical protein H0H81_003005 [Sphagnurus paluster]